MVGKTLSLHKKIANIGRNLMQMAEIKSFLSFLVDTNVGNN